MRPYIRQNARTALAILIMGNLPFVIARQVIYVNRPFLYLDYVVLGSLTPYLPRCLNLGLFASFVIADVILSVAGAYHFPNLVWLYALTNVAYLNPLITVPLAVIILSGITLWVAVHSRTIRTSDACPQSANVLLSLSIGVLVLGATWLLPANAYVGSLTLRTNALHSEFAPLRVTHSDTWKAASATGMLHRELESEGCISENLVLMIVESLGEAIDADVVHDFEARLRSAAQASSLTFVAGSVPFDSSTVGAEFRELCGLGQGYRVVNSDTREFASDCLPSTLRACGYETVAIHGYTSRMFWRGEWYPKLQFDRRVFMEDMPEQSGVRYCGAEFRGVCDFDALQLVRRELISPSSRPKLVYWLTLNTHVGFDDFINDDDLQTSCAARYSRYPDDVCRLFSQQDRLLAALANLIADPQLPPTRFIIVGDHSPVFLMKTKRAHFSQTEVPYFYISSKSALRVPNSHF